MCYQGIEDGSLRTRCQENPAAIRKPLLIRLVLCIFYILSLVPLRKPNSMQTCWKHCWAAQSGRSLQLHHCCEILGGRNCSPLLLPANNRKSHSLSQWGLAQCAMRGRSVCQTKQVLLFFGFDFPGTRERKGETIVCV